MLTTWVIGSESLNSGCVLKELAPKRSSLEPTSCSSRSFEDLIFDDDCENRLFAQHRVTV